DQTGHLTAELRRQMATCRDQVAAQDVELANLQTGSNLAPNERAEALRSLERRLAVNPARVLDHLAVVSALLEIDPDDTASQSLYFELLDVVARLVIAPSRDERISAALAIGPRLLGDRGCIAQAKFHLRHGQIEPALGSLLPLLDDANASPRSLLWLFTIARRFRDAYTSARALERVAATFRPALRGLLEAIAAEMYLDARAADDALRLSAKTMRTSHNVPRLVTLATRLVDYAEPELAQLDIEHAMSRVLPSARFCRMLARSHRLAGEPEIALAWLQRAVSLRPGDVELRGLQLELALELGDATRLVDILCDFIAQALPVSAWAESAASALAWLTSVDPARSLAVGRRLLDCNGASHRSLRAALLDAAQINGDEEFAIDVLERAAATASESSDLQLALAERCWKSGHYEAARLAALRATRCGADVESWAAYAVDGSNDTNADAELLRLELERLLHLSGKATGELRATLRRLAAARFDWAQDIDGALACWRELTQTNAADWGCVVRDMGMILGAQTAAERLQELAPNVEPASTRAMVWGLCAQLLEEAGEANAAIELFEKALVTAPESTCLLPLVQRVTQARHDVEGLDAVYGTLEGAILGIYGERCLHYRAARTFEHIEEYSAALRHAVAAFEARPDDDSTWTTLVRISRVSRQPQALALSAMRVVEVARDRSRTRPWLERAYRELGDDQEGLRLKFDLAIRMLVGSPDVRGVNDVAACVRGMAEHGVEEIEFIRLRFERALDSLLVELVGPDGARLGIAIALAATKDLGRLELASRALFAAIQADADLEEFATLIPTLVPRVAEA
ncbi:MAG TPA: hypothetical protein VKP30_09360, partial [Polyangiaceae bacterium]|nr:hypothetical protein [Polyangiaceae bacterium]